jgi:riboflavin synthase
MFTGIISGIGIIRSAARPSNESDTVFEVEGPYAADGIAIGASIAHSGVCLTVIALERLGKDHSRWTLQASDETLGLTTAKDWTVGTQLNLERALKAGDELGGHIVAGHVDGVGVVESVISENESWRVRIRVPKPLHRYIAQKGSVAVDGVSLTVNEVADDVFGVNIIPHTWTVTTLGRLSAGATVNIEIDLMARYAARLMETADA